MFKPIIDLPNNLLKKMLFVSQLETIEACNQSQRLRLLPRNQRIFTEKAVQAVMVDPPSPLPAGISAKSASALAWAELDCIGASIPLEEDTFPAWLVSHDSPAGEKKQLEFDDLYFFDEQCPFGAAVVAIPHVVVIQGRRGGGSAAGKAADSQSNQGKQRALIAFRPGGKKQYEGPAWKQEHRELGMLNVGQRVSPSRVASAKNVCILCLFEVEGLWLERYYLIGVLFRRSSC
jgi:hypothetical protein